MINMNNGKVSGKFFPRDFQPGPYDVLIGRGKKCYNHVGNIHFRNLVANNLGDYSRSKTKQEKSHILADLVKQIRKISPNGGFLKQDIETGLWYEVGGFLAREKTSQAFRDALHENYRSSNSFKKQQRRKYHKSKSSDCKVVKVDISPDRTISVDCDDIFADFSSSTFDMDTTELERSIDQSHQSTRVTEQPNDGMEDLEEFSMSANSELMDIEMDDLSNNSTFDGNIDDLFVEDYSLFEMDNGFENFAQSILLKGQAKDFCGVESLSSLEKGSKTHTDYKAMFVSSAFDGFSALPSRNINVAKTA